MDKRLSRHDEPLMTRCDWAFWHLGVTAMLVAVAIPIALLTEPRWSPFDEVLSSEAVIENKVFTVTYRLKVNHRYPVRFTHRLVHPASGIYTEPKISASATAQIGEFSLQMSLPLPEQPLLGKWCFVSEATIHYNVMIPSKTHRYDPVCTIYR